MNFLNVALGFIVKNRKLIVAGAIVLFLLAFLYLIYLARTQAREISMLKQNYSAMHDTLRTRILKDSVREYARESLVRDLRDSLKIEAERSKWLNKLLSIAKASITAQHDTIEVQNVILDTSGGRCNIKWEYNEAGSSWSSHLKGISTIKTTKITENVLNFNLVTGYAWNDKKHIEFFARTDCPIVRINNLSSCVVDVSGQFPRPPLIPWWVHELIGAAGATAVIFGIPYLIPDKK